MNSFLFCSESVSEVFFVCGEEASTRGAEHTEVCEHRRSAQLTLPQAEKTSLSLGELACSSSLLETRLFTLFHSWVSCQETCCLECRSVSLFIDFAKCSCDSVSECSGLACETAAVNGSDNIEAAECSCKFERSSDFVFNDIFLAEVCEHRRSA